MNPSTDILVVSASNHSRERNAVWLDTLIHFLSILLKRLLKHEVNIRTVDLSEFTAKMVQDYSVIILYVSLFHNNESEKLAEEPLRLMDELKQQGYPLFKIQDGRLPDTMLPHSLVRLLGYDFYEYNDDTGEILRYEDTGNELSEKKYWLSLIELAYNLYNTIFMLENESESSYAATIFLAEASAEQAENRNIIKRELQQFGHRILPDEVLDADAELLKEKLNLFLSKSSLAVHIIGSERGRSVIGSADDIVVFQNRIAAQFCYQESGITLQRIIWIDSSIEQSDETYRLAVDQIKQDPLALSNAEVAEIPLELLKTLIRKKVKEFYKPLESTLYSFISAQKEKRVYIIHRKEDADEVYEVAHEVKSTNLTPLLTDFDNKTTNPVSEHRKKLITCEGVIIWYLNPNKMWLESKFNDLRKAPGYGRTRQFNGIAVIYKDQKPDVPPEPEIQLIAHNQLNEVLNDFLQNIKEENSSEKTVN